MNILLKKLSISFIAICATASALVACSDRGASPKEDGTDDGLLASVDTMFGTVNIPEPKDELRVLALGWSDAETVLALGVTPIGVKDWGAFGEENKGVGPWATPLFGDAAPKVIPNSVDLSTDFEQIASMAPDLILSVSSANNENDYRRLSEIAPTIYGPSGTTAFAPGWRLQTQVIASALGKEEKGAQLVADLEEKFSTARSEHPEFAELTTVTGIKYADAYGVSLSGDLRHDFLGDLGFKSDPTVDDLPGAQGYFAPVSAENVDVLDSDVTIIVPVGHSAEDVRNDRFLRTLPVVEDGRAVILDSSGELAQAFTAASILSVPIIIDQTLPLLAKAAAQS